MREVKRCENCGNEQIQILNYKGDYLCGICGRDTERLHEIEHDAEIRAKAIDEFAERLKLKYPYFVEDVGFVEANKMLHHAIDEIAEEMKKGGGE